jgi:hypothetical protein
MSQLIIRVNRLVWHSDEMHFDKKEAIFFRRNAAFAWP